jgi:hypothetical protein
MPIRRGACSWRRSTTGKDPPTHVLVQPSQNASTQPYRCHHRGKTRFEPGSRETVSFWPSTSTVSLGPFAEHSTIGVLYPARKIAQRFEPRSYLKSGEFSFPFFEVSHWRLWWGSPRPVCHCATLRRALPDFLQDPSKNGFLAKFIADRQDLRNMAFFLPDRMTTMRHS